MSRTFHHVSHGQWRRVYGNAARWIQYLWLRQKPKWFRHQRHIKMRAELRQALIASKDWDEAVFPSDSKPRPWYW